MTAFFGASDAPPLTVWQRPPAPEDGTDAFLGDVGRFVGNFEANQDLQRYVNNAYSDLAAAEWAIDQRNDAIRKATGVALDNPYRQWISPEDRANAAQALGYPRSSGGEPVVRKIFDDRARAYESRLGELGRQFAGNADALAAIRPELGVDADRKALASVLEERAARAGAQPFSSSVFKYGSAFLGTMAGWIRDPANVAQVAAGWGGGSAASTLAGAVVRTALREAVFNGAGEAAVQPAVQKWRKELGLEAGVGPALENIGTAAVFGGVLGGALEGVGHVLRRPRGGAVAPPAPSVAPEAAPVAPPVIERALAGQDEALIAAARESGDPVLGAGADALELDNVARGAPPAGVDPAEHGVRFAEAVRFAEDPEQGIDVWHGSAHAFDAFSSEPIGTGQGAQLEGHGLYFAEDRATGEWYAHNYAKPRFVLPDGAELPFPDAMLAGLPPDARSYMAETIRDNPDAPDMKNLLLARLHQARKGFEGEAGQTMQDLAGFLHALPDGTRFTVERHLYRARITRPVEDFVDLDARLDAQPEAVRGALGRLGVTDGTLTGRAAMERLGQLSGSAMGDRRLAALLHDEGLAGVRYLDGASREGGADSRNYVVFSADDVQALARNGVPFDRALPPGAHVAGNGAFGPIVSGFELAEGRQWRAAVKLLRTIEDGEVRGALHHPEIGPIDLVWGRYDPNTGDGLGLAKIVGKHPEVLDRLGDVVADGAIESESANRIRLVSEHGRAVVRLEFDGETKKWLMTAYDPRAGGRTESPGGLQAGSHSSPASRASANIAPESAVEKAAPSRGVLDAYPLADEATGGTRLVTSDALKAAPTRDAELAAAVRGCNLWG